MLVGTTGRTCLRILQVQSSTCGILDDTKSPLPQGVGQITPIIGTISFVCIQRGYLINWTNNGMGTRLRTIIRRDIPDISLAIYKIESISSSMSIALRLRDAGRGAGADGRKGKRCDNVTSYLVLKALWLNEHHLYTCLSSSTRLLTTLQNSEIMVNGPPTPPATTPAELHDEARASIPLDYSSAPISVPTTSHPSPEVYQNAIPLMSEAIARDDYSRLVHIAERTDTSVCVLYCFTRRNVGTDSVGPNSSVQTNVISRAYLLLPHWSLAILFLTICESTHDSCGMISRSQPGLMYRRTPARYALLRLPDNLASLPLSRALSALVTATVNRQHSAVYDHANTLNTVVSHPDFTDKELAGVISQLLSVFIGEYSTRDLSYSYWNDTSRYFSTKNIRIIVQGIHILTTVPGMHLPCFACGASNRRWAFISLTLR